MESSEDLIRYLMWGSPVPVGTILAVVDWRLIHRPVFGILLLLGVAGGLGATVLSPFNFSDGGYYMEGVLAAAGSALGLGGYVVAALFIFAWRQVATRRTG
jgi:hypothetical protein